MPRKPSPSIAPSANRSTSPPPDTQATILTIPLKRIGPSPTNPRKTFDPVKLQELADSIRSKGLLQPILVRPTYKNHKSGCRDPLRPGVYWAEPHNWPSMTYELVAGERRFRAAELAGLTEIQATVRDLSDLGVLECQVVENEQREDVTPLERADGYARLVDDHGVAVEDLATRVGKSTATIYGLLKLRTLSPDARAAVDAGTISLSIAQLIARIPGQETRDDALRYALEPDYAGSLSTFREMQRYVERECMIELKQAPFDRNAPDLTSAGACTSCPKLTGNNPTEYPDSRADICLDPACFRAKEAAHREAVLAEAKDQGRTILKGKAAEEALSYRSTYYDLADTCYEITKPKTFAKLVGKDLREQTVVAVDERGRIHQLVAKKDALPLLKEKHGLAKHVAANGQTKSKADVEFKRQEKKTRALEKLGLAAVVAKAETLFGSAATLGMGPPQEAFLRAVCKQAAAVAWSETRRHLVARRQIPLDNSKSQYERLEKSLDAYIATLGKTQLFGLLAEIVCSREFHGGAYNSGERSKRILRALDIDPAKIADDVKAELNGKPKPGKPTAQEELVEIGLLDSVEPQTTSQDYDEALRRSLEQVATLTGWSRAQQQGANDAEVRRLVIKQWTRGVGKLNGRTTDLFVNVGDVMSYCRCRDEAASAAGSRIVLMFWHDSIEPKGKPTLDDAGVLAAVRRLKNIPQPKPIGNGPHGDPSAWVELLQNVDACRVCHCTEEKFQPSGAYWVEPNLCSACVANGADPITDEGKEAATIVRRAQDTRRLRKGSKA